ncbi:sensor histidine kinase [Jeotgalibacillus soli]|uniref:Sensor histidine kinase n=1 Tax=Jeotgalibacillus soli TaxID=889306 RepID=A0A0C2VV27_9BACL|nr:sensor histidine kinase [Jeotgalibacillus soli]KIL48281.1 histidine kinase [Jeotgalibacillus soli]
MSILTRMMAQTAGLTIVILVFSFGLYLFFFPPRTWGTLWATEIIDIPIGLFIVFGSVTLAGAWSIIQGVSIRNQIHYVNQQLTDLELGRSTVQGNPPSIPELQQLSERANHIQSIINEQAKTAQKLASEKVENQEKLIQEMVSQERNRLARELHDSVSQQLFAASMMMSAVNESKDSTNVREAKQLQMVEEMIHQSQLEMRALLLHLRPVALKGKTLKEGIEELLLELQHKVPLAIAWKTEDMKLAKGIEDHLFRILQESVSNTLRHAKATMLDVLCIQRDGYVILRVQDDGSGFNVSEGKTGSYGLQNMRERAIEIGGTFKLISLPNKGTKLEVKVPFESRKEAKHD